MFRCDSYYLILICVIIILFKILNSFNYFISGETLLLDIILRLELNDALLNAFSFYWTSFSYLPHFLLLIFYSCIFYIQTQNMRPLLLLFPILYLTLLFKQTSTVWLEFNHETNLILNSFINELLLNSLNKYHPFIFYSSSLLLIFTCILFLNNIENRGLFKTSTTSFMEIHIITLTLIINLISLFLGSWWALQESTWGGWWNWDASEVFGLLVSFSCLMRLHSLQTLNNQYLFYIKYWIWIFFFFISYVIVQISFSMLSHNFGIEILGIFNSQLFIISFTIFCFFWPTIFLTQYWSNLHVSLILLGKKVRISRFNFWLIFIFYNLFIAALLIISYIPLFEDYLSSDLVYAVSLLSPTWLILSLTIIILLLVINKDFINYYSTLLLNIILLNLPVNIIVSSILVKYCNIRIMHILLVLLFILDLKSSNTSYIIIDYALFNQEVIEDFIILQPNQVTYTCNASFLQRIISYSDGISYFNSFSNLYQTSLYNPNNYILISDPDSFSNFYFRSYNLSMKYYNIKNVMLTNLVDFLILISSIVLLLTKILPSIKTYY